MEPMVFHHRLLHYHIFLVRVVISSLHFFSIVIFLNKVIALRSSTQPGTSHPILRALCLPLSWNTSKLSVFKNPWGSSPRDVLPSSLFSKVLPTTGPAVKAIVPSLMNTGKVASCHKN